MTKEKHKINKFFSKGEKIRKNLFELRIKVRNRSIFGKKAKNVLFQDFLKNPKKFLNIHQDGDYTEAYWWTFAKTDENQKGSKEVIKIKFDPQGFFVISNIFYRTRTISIERFYKRISTKEIEKFDFLPMNSNGFIGMDSIP